MFRPVCLVRQVVRWNSTVAKAGVQTASSTGAGNKKFLSPDQYVELKKQQEIADAEYKKELLSAPYEYNPQCIMKDKVDPATERPIPLNVELLKYRPIQLPKTHGHKVASITLTGYDRSSLDFAAEFACRAAFYLGIPTGGPTNLRVKEKLFTVIRSPFAQAKSKENFKKYTYGRKITAFDADSEVLDIWLTFINKHKHDGIDYKANVLVRENEQFASNLSQISGEDLSLPKAYATSDDPVTQKVQELLQSKEFKKYFDEK